MVLSKAQNIEVHLAREQREKQRATSKFRNFEVRISVQQ
jgi:hypothetical protein